MKKWIGIICLAVTSYAADLGLFEGETDIGGPSKAGQTAFESNQYKISGGGSNMWFASDAFHFVWKKVSGDIALAADISVDASTGDAHRKGVLMVRQSLDADSAYADAALHGDGLTSLQYRETKGARTYEIQANAKGPRRLRIEKRGKYVSMSIAGPGEELHPAGGSFRLILQEPFYIGLGVCSHNDSRLESAAFSDVVLAKEAAETNLLCAIETITIASKDRRVSWTTADRIESPAWTADGSNLIFKTRTGLQIIPVAGGKPEALTLDISRDETARETTLDGKYAFFHSDRSGSSQIWRSRPDGTEPEQLTDDDFNNWFPHPSPDGRWLVFLSYDKDIKGHPAYRDVTLRIMPLAGGKIETLAKLFGGQGTINFPSWSPDSRRLAFISYQRRP